MRTPEADSLNTYEIVHTIRRHPAEGATHVPGSPGPPGMSESSLAERLRELTAMLVRMRFSRHDAEDASQEAALVGLQYLHGGKAPAVTNPEAWLRTVAVRAACKAAGRRLACDPVAVEAAAAAPCEEVARRDEAEALLRAIGELPEGPRQALVFCALEGHTYGEAAGQFGVCAGAVGRRLLAARVTLRDRLRGRGFDPAGRE